MHSRPGLARKPVSLRNAMRDLWLRVWLVVLVVAGFCAGLILAKRNSDDDR